VRRWDSGSGGKGGRRPRGIDGQRHELRGEGRHRLGRERHALRHGRNIGFAVHSIRLRRSRRSRSRVPLEEVPFLLVAVPPHHVAEDLRLEGAQLPRALFHHDHALDGVANAADADTAGGVVRARARGAAPGLRKQLQRVTAGDEGEQLLVDSRVGGGQ
jgi:hypothetical protein